MSSSDCRVARSREREHSAGGTESPRGLTETPRLDRGSGCLLCHTQGGGGSGVPGSVETGSLSVNQKQI